jgi:hypothetical protein
VMGKQIKSVEETDPLSSASKTIDKFIDKIFK